jgi:hypothetical protein
MATNPVPDYMTLDKIQPDMQATIASVPWSNNIPIGDPEPVLRACLPSILSKTVLAK